MLFGHSKYLSRLLFYFNFLFLRKEPEDLEG